MTPKAPRALRSLGKGSRRARTILAAKLTIADAMLQLSRSGKRVGGLRGGRVSVSKKTVTFRSYRYLEGVRVTGRVRRGRGTLKVAGGGASPIRITLSKGRLRVHSAVGRGVEGHCGALDFAGPEHALARAPLGVVPEHVVHPGLLGG